MLTQTISRRGLLKHVWLAAVATIAIAQLPLSASAQSAPPTAQPAPAVSTPTASAFRAGAAKVDITPNKTALPKGFEGINDPIYARAVVLDDGTNKAALVTVDAGAIGNDTWAAVTKAAQQELGIMPERVLITATHTHSVPFRMDPTAQIMTALRKAAAAMQPARVAFGQGVSYINVNRNLIDPATHRWWEGPNYEGPSDKTVGVVRVETPGGQPIAIYYNYAVHAVINGQLDQVSGDIPGATSRYIETALDDKAVALWSEGAAGDQNPIFFQQTYDLRAIRVADYAKRGEDISNAMPPGGQGLNKRDPQVIKLMTQQRQLTNAMGQMLGEEVLRVNRDTLDRPETNPRLFGATKTITCPGRTRTDQGRAGYPGTYVDGDAIPIRLSLLKIGNIEIGGVNGEVFNPIAQRFKARSGSSRTMMATLTNGMAPSGYIPNDEAFTQNTFEVVSSRLKQGCAEGGIINGLLDLEQASERP
jgi:neutral ceramidase